MQRHHVSPLVVLTHNATGCIHHKEKRFIWLTALVQGEAAASDSGLSAGGSPEQRTDVFWSLLLTGPRNFLPDDFISCDHLPETHF